MRARCPSTEGYKHSMVLRHLTHFARIASQNMVLAHGIHLSRIPKPNVVIQAGFNFVLLKPCQSTSIYVYLYLLSKDSGVCIAKKITMNHVTSADILYYLFLLLMLVAHMINLSSFFSFPLSSHSPSSPTNHNFVDITHSFLLSYVSMIYTF